MSDGSLGAIGEPRIFIDADGCPVKEEACRVARRYGFRVFVVANSRMRVPPGDLVELVLVGDRFDAADDWIAERAAEGDIVVTADIPLAARSLEKKARALDPKGRVFTEDSIGGALADRELMATLRELGEISGGPAPFERRDRSRFLEKLDELIQGILRARRQIR